MTTSISVFGIRHHGPGSARSLLSALDDRRPDCLLIEGPPEGQDLLAFAADAAMVPPVAILIYAADDARQAVYYPFADFSPEWQAIRYGLRHSIVTRFMDLPLANRLALDSAAAEEKSKSGDLPDAESEQPAPPLTPDPTLAIRLDPLGSLAAAAGYSDGERWWEQMVEHRQQPGEIFTAILEAMTALREQLSADQSESAESTPTTADGDLENSRREAAMRQAIRAAEKEGFERIAVVCGAWHGPALIDRPPARRDADLLKGLPKLKVATTWIPWTNARLSQESGYGAGVMSPGWYGHIWNSLVAGESGNSGAATGPPLALPDSARRLTVGWMSNVARCLRERDLDASPASVIEAVRLSETLASLRDQALPGLEEMNEAALTVFCMGNSAPMQLIREKLIVGDRLGHVPDEVPMVPLAADVAREQKRLRLPAEASVRVLDLDLRKPNDLDRSRLLRRLNVLGVPWGEWEDMMTGKGTFREHWRIAWRPEFAVELIEAGVWGNSVLQAAEAFAADRAKHASDLPSLTKLLDMVLLADLPEAAAGAVARIQSEAALASDIAHLMQALPDLATILRYGSVRQMDASSIAEVVDGLIARISVGLAAACSSLNDDSAQAMIGHLGAVDQAVRLLENPEHEADWSAALIRLVDQSAVHGLVAGRVARLLLDGARIDADAVARHMSLALSAANEPQAAAAWIEGFLGGSGALLLHDERVWTLVDAWVVSLKDEIFVEVLPLIRRTFATFSPAERRQMGEAVKRTAGASGARAPEKADDNIDHARAAQVLPLLETILGLNHPHPVNPVNPVKDENHE